MLVGGEQRGITLTSDENAGCKVLDSSKALSLLKHSDHLLSSLAILVSVELVPEDFLDLEGNLSFLGFFSGGTEEEGGDLTVSCWPTTPMTDTLAGSTSSEDSLVGVAVSDFCASRFSFFSLYEGVDI